MNGTAVVAPAEVAEAGALERQRCADSLTHQANQYSPAEGNLKEVAPVALGAATCTCPSTPFEKVCMGARKQAGEIAARCGTCCASWQAEANPGRGRATRAYGMRSFDPGAHRGAGSRGDPEHAVRAVGPFPAQRVAHLGGEVGVRGAQRPGIDVEGLDGGGGGGGGLAARHAGARRAGGARPIRGAAHLGAGQQRASCRAGRRGQGG